MPRRAARCAARRRRPSPASDRRRRSAIVPRVGAYKPDDEPRDGRLAAARFADEPERLARRDRQADAVDRLAAARAACAPSTRSSHGGETSNVRATSVSVEQRCPASAGCHPVARCATPAGGARRCRPAASSGRSLPAARRRRAGSADGTRSRPGIASSRGIAPSICARRSRSADDRRDRPHEAHRVRMRGPVDHVGDRPDLDDAPRVHHRDAVGGLGDHAHVVRDRASPRCRGRGRAASGAG